MRQSLLVVLVLLGAANAHASSTGGLCEDAAIEKALETAPGQDASSPAHLVEIKLVKSKPFGTNKIETYFVRTEDQGGLAASLISYVAVDNSSLENEVLVIDCEFAKQTWVE